MISLHLTQFKKTIFIILGLLTALVASGTGAAFIILSHGPLDLSFLKSRLVLALHSGNTTLDFNKLYLTWKDWRGPLVLEGTGIEYQTRQKDRGFNASIKQIRLSFKITSLLQGHTMPKEVFIQDPLLVTGPLLTQNSPKEPIDLEFGEVEDFLEQIIGLRHAKIEGGIIRIEDAISKDLKVKLNFRGSFDQKGEQATGFLMVTSMQSPIRLGAQMTYHSKNKKINISAALTQVDSSFTDALCAVPFFKSLLFSQANFYLDYTYSLKSGKQGGQIEASILKTKLDNKAFWSRPLGLGEVVLKGGFLEDTLALEARLVAAGEIPVFLKIKGKFHAKEDFITFESNAEVQNILIENLKNLWPQGAAAQARAWITEHMTSGYLTKAHMHMKNKINFAKPDSLFEFEKVSGTLEIDNASLTYLETMPGLTGLKAKALFDQEHFDIVLQQGNSHGLKIKGGNVYIGAFSKDECMLRLKVDLEGGLNKVLELINHDPLFYGRDYGLNAFTAEGKVQATLKMDFPLTLPFNEAAIKAFLTAQVNKAKLTEVVGLPVTLTEGGLTLQVTPEKISIKGKGNFNKAPSTLHFEKHFNSNRVHLKVNSNATEQSLKPFGDLIPKLLIGQFPLEVTYDRPERGPEILRLSSNLQNTEINLLTYKKPVGEKATFRGEAVLKNGSFHLLKNATLQTDSNWEVRGSGTVAPDHKTIEWAKVAWAKGEKFVARLDYTQDKKGMNFLDIKGDHLDLIPFVEEQFKSQEGSFDYKAPLKVRFRIDRLRLSPRGELLNNEGSLYFEGGFIQSLKYEGDLEKIEGKKGGHIVATIDPLGKSFQKIRLQTDGGGSFLRSLDLFDNIQGGHLMMVGYRDLKVPMPEWTCKLRIKEFSLLNAPLLTRFFSFVFPTGLVDLVDGQGMRFSVLKMRFGLSEKSFNIFGCTAYGYSLGFSLNGLVERGDKGRINLKGNMIPAYAFNTLLSNVPILGDLLFGGKNKGMFMISFSVKGYKKEPDIQSNPLTVLTPGILREFFSASGNEKYSNDPWLQNDAKEDVNFEKEYNEK